MWMFCSMYKSIEKVTKNDSITYLLFQFFQYLIYLYFVTILLLEQLVHWQINSIGIKYRLKV